MTVDLGIPGLTQGVPAGSSRRWKRYLARTMAAGRGVAVLMVDQPTPSDVETLRTTAGRLIRASHDRGALTIHRAGMTAEGKLYLIMAHPGGRSLRTYLSEVGAPGAVEAVEWERNVRAALAVAHRDGLVHGQVSADSIIITNRGRALLADMAVATLDRHAGLSNPRATPHGDVAAVVDLFAQVLTADVRGGPMLLAGPRPDAGGVIVPLDGQHEPALPPRPEPAPVSSTSGDDALEELEDPHDDPQGEPSGSDAVMYGGADLAWLADGELTEEVTAVTAAPQQDVANPVLTPAVPAASEPTPARGTPVVPVASAASVARTRRGPSPRLVAAAVLLLVGVGAVAWFVQRDDGGVDTTDVEVAGQQQTPSPAPATPTPRLPPTATTVEITGPPPAGSEGLPFELEPANTPLPQTGDASVLAPEADLVGVPPPPAPIISSAGVVAADLSQVTLGLVTDLCTTVVAEYTAAAGDTGLVTSGPPCSNDHRIVLGGATPLLPGTLYTATLTATSEASGVASTVVSFTTASTPPTPTPVPPPPTATPLPTLPQPVVDTVVAVAARDTVQVNFSTNVCTNARYDWVSLDGSVGGTLLSDAWPDAEAHCWRQHAVQLADGLESGRRYVLTIAVVDRLGRQASSQVEFSMP